jgi:hypothetical protein|tara:strand:+ start:791 stop:1228 length:438 start_codon:yes stop_codon:yes gene_type:complete
MEKFAIFDKSSFPKITVKFSKKIYSFDDYKDFENEWLQCYMEYKDFYFVFDTTAVGYVNPVYGYYLTSFIKKIKKLKYDYLKFNIIIVNNWYIKQLLFWVFQVQSPVADVYIVEKNVNVENLIDNINNKIIVKDENIYVAYKENT